MAVERVRFKKVLEEQYPNMTILIETNITTQRITAAYMEAKICVIIHSHNRASAGEYHRISDFAKFGCVPVVETIADTDVGAKSFLTECAGMVSAGLDELVPSVVKVLEGKIHFDDMQARIDWWNNGVEWSTLLKRIFPAEISEYTSFMGLIGLVFVLYVFKKRRYQVNPFWILQIILTRQKQSRSA